MPKRWLFPLFLALVLAMTLTACAGDDENGTDADPENGIVDNGTNGDDNDTNDLDDDDDDNDTEENTLRTEETSVHLLSHGNTNGNAHNSGLALYDGINALHYYAVGPSVFSYDPASRVRSHIFTMAEEGVVEHLNLHNDVLYFLTSAEGWLMRHDLTENETEVLSEIDHDHLIRLGTRLYVIHHDDPWSDGPVMGSFNPETNQYGSQSVGGTSLLNVFRSRVFYVPGDAVQIDLRSDRDFMGRVTHANLSDELDGIDEMVFMDFDQDLKSKIALIATREGERSLYTYDSDTEELVELYQSPSGAIRQLNYDGEHLYFLEEGDLRRIHLETGNERLVAEVGADVRDIIIVNHWIYYRTDETDRLYRIDPATEDVTILLDE